MSARYRIEDLWSETGASFSTIRYWIHKKVIPGAIGRGKYAYYSQETLDGLRNVLAAYDNNVTLADIRDRRYPPNDDEDE